MKRKGDPSLDRRQKALSTRRRMLRAAHDAFCERGYAGTTMELIAERASVAVQTLYFTFHTKSAILEETLGAAILGFEHWDPRVATAVAADSRKAFADYHPWFPAFASAKTSAEALAVFVETSVDIFERVAPLVVAMASAAFDPQVKAGAQRAEERRVEGYAYVVELLAKRGKLRRGMNVRRATDVILTILSAETYQQLSRRGWKPDDCRKWFTEVLVQQLLG